MRTRAPGMALLLGAACAGPDPAEHPRCLARVDAETLSPIETRVLAEAARRIAPRCTVKDGSEPCRFRIAAADDGGWTVFIDYLWQDPRSGECLQAAGAFEAQRYDGAGSHIETLHGF